jgi:hypothetical protein
MNTMQSVQQQLRFSVEQKTRVIGISDTSERLIEELVEQTTFQLRTDGLLEDEQAILRAEQNLDRFIAEMIAEADRLGYGELREDTFFAAKRKICPLWPIC